MWNRQQGFLDYDLCRIYGRQVVEGLRHLHREGLAHRDLTLSNVLVDIRSNSVKVADLGLAVCSRDFVMARPVTALNFRAPEALIHSVVKESFTLKDPQTTLDMWSLGVLLVALWCGSLLFAKKRPLEVLQEIVVIVGPPVIWGPAGVSASGPGMWPGIVDLPKWQECSARLQCVAGAGINDALCSKSMVKRPIESKDPMLDLVPRLVFGGTLQGAWIARPFWSMTRGAKRGMQPNPEAITQHRPPS
jgi:hypothetical protein